MFVRIYERTHISTLYNVHFIWLQSNSTLYKNHASALFNRIATEIHNSSKHDRKPVLKKNTLEWFIGKSGDIANIVNSIGKLFETGDEIEIIGNMKLDEQLELLAKLLSTPIKAANDTVIGRLVQKTYINSD